MEKIYVGIDNGASGSIAILGLGKPQYYKTPSKKEQDYTIKKQNITRIDYPALVSLMQKNLIKPACQLQVSLKQDVQIMVLLERPYVNLQNAKTGRHAVRAHEATIIMLEEYGLPFQVCDSGKWQKMLLPAGTKGTPELKKASKDIGSKLFPCCIDMIKKQKDADGLLIAEWARREQL